MLKYYMAFFTLHYTFHYIEKNQDQKYISWKNYRSKQIPKYTRCWTAESTRTWGPEMQHHRINSYSRQEGSTQFGTDEPLVIFRQTDSHTHQGSPNEKEGVLKLWPLENLGIYNLPGH